MKRSSAKIMYEVVAEFSSIKATSEVFHSQNFLGARAKALCYFLELVLDDYDSQTAPPFVRVYAHNRRNGNRVEILNSDTYRYGNHDLRALQEEFQMFRTEKIPTPVAVIKSHSHMLSIHADYKNLKALRCTDNVVILSDNYWMFIRQKSINYLTA